MLLQLVVLTVLFLLALILKLSPLGMTVVTPLTLTKDTGTPTSAAIATVGTAFTDASSLTIAYPIEGKLIVIINSTYAGANTVTVAAGATDGVGAGIAAGQGDLTITTAQNGVYYVVLSSERFKTYYTSTGGEGYITLTFGTSNTGFVYALQLPS
jgi:hypothetical protein